MGWRVHDRPQQLGLPDDAEFAVPSTQRLAAGAPPGAAEPDEWLAAIRRALRAAGFPPQEARKIGLHAAKRTILTWAGSSGIFGERDIEVLGHHRCSGIGQVVCAYNVTVLAAPVTKLRQLLEYIAKGDFDPDGPAGMQWREGAYPGLLPAGRPAPTLPAAAPLADAPTTAAAQARSPAGPPAGAPGPEAPQAGATGTTAQQTGRAGEPAAGGEDRAAAAPAKAAPSPNRPPSTAARAQAAEQPAPPVGHSAPRPPPGPGPDPYGYITPINQRGARRKYVHVATPVGADGAKACKVTVNCEHGVVTNLCDFRILSAVWDSSLGFSDAELCEVCKARVRRPDQGR